MNASQLVRGALGLAVLAALAQPQVTQKGQLSLQIFRDPQPAAGCVGESVMLDVLAYPAAVSYQWRRNGVPLVPSQNGPTLTLGSLSEADAGAYDVVVTLGNKAKASAAATVTVKNVTITVQPGPGMQLVSPGTPIVYSVTATGHGNLTYQWRKKPTIPFTPFSEIPGATSPVLDLGNVTGSDSGTYKCTVRNECGPLNTVNCRLIVVQ